MTDIHPRFIKSGQGADRGMARKKGREDKSRKGESISPEILECRNKDVVIDTDSNFLYIGKLLNVTRHFVTLADTEVHDRRESATLNEKYLIDRKKFGIRSNRKKVSIRLDRLISFSLLEDIIDY
jgi:hypothetical protein